MLVWDEAKNTVTFSSATVGRLALSASDMITAEYIPPSAGSLGGTIVRTTLVAGPGTVEVAAEAGKSCTVKSNSAATTASLVVLLNLDCLQID
jgi:hypothetical protein